MERQGKSLFCLLPCIMPNLAASVAVWFMLCEKLTKIANAAMMFEVNSKPTQNVNLTATLDTFVKTQVSLGHFNNASEVHRSALAAMARKEEERELRMEQLRLEIQLGIDDVRAGRSAKVTSAKALGSMLDGCLNMAAQRLERANAEPLE